MTIGAFGCVLFNSVSIRKQVNAMCKTYENLLERKSAKDLTNKDIANAMTAIYGDSISADTVQKIFSHQQGVMLDHLAPLIQALGLKMVTADSVVLDPDEYKALKTFAKKGIDTV